MNSEKLFLIKIECLKAAIQSLHPNSLTPEAVIKAAKEMFEFVSASQS